MTRLKIVLIHHPTTSLHLTGFSDPAFEPFFDNGVYLGNTYGRIMPPSLPRVASLLTRHLGADVDILDLRLHDGTVRETYKTVRWEDQYTIRAERVGSPFDHCNDAVESADWVGLTSHFTFESGVVRDLIRHIRAIKPRVKIMVGGADVKARPRDYLNFGADLAFIGDCDPSAVAAFNGEPRIVGPYAHPFDDLTRPSFEKLSRLPDYVDSHDGPVPDGVRYPIGFIYFTRGCPRECDFCESRQTKFETLHLDAALAMVEHYRANGILSLNFSDDNLLLMAAKKQGRETILTLFRTLRAQGFAWEFPNGLEIGRFLSNGKIDEELVEAVFSHSTDPITGQKTGAYRLYVPLETFERQQDYKKLKAGEDMHKLLECVAKIGLPEIDFGIVLPPSATPQTFALTRDGYLRVREIVESNSETRARYAVFHLIPIALHRAMATKYSVEEFPEGWNFYFPIYDGKHLSARELFEHRLKLVKEIDPPNFQSMRLGQYAYG